MKVTLKCALIVAIAGIVVPLLLIRPVFTVHVERTLSGISDGEVRALINDGASLEEIQMAVRATGKHVDEIDSFSPVILVAVARGREDVVQWLLEQGSDPNGIGPGFDPLGAAVFSENTRMIELLVEKGADPDLDLGDGVTVREYAEDQGNPDVIRALGEEKGSGVGEEKGKKRGRESGEGGRKGVGSRFGGRKGAGSRFDVLSASP